MIDEIIKLINDLDSGNYETTVSMIHEMIRGYALSGGDKKSLLSQLIALRQEYPDNLMVDELLTEFACRVEDYCSPYLRYTWR